MIEPSISDLTAIRALRDAERNDASRRAKGVDSGGRPPDPPDMERRIATLEAAIPRIETRLDRMEARADARADATDARLRAVEQSITRVGGKMDLLAGQIVSRLPTWWQMLGIFVAIVALLNGLPVLMQSLRTRGVVP